MGTFQTIKNRKHHNIKEFVGIKKIKNGLSSLPRREYPKSMVDVLTMSWMQQRELINFVRNWESLKRILESMGCQINNGKPKKRHHNTEDFTGSKNVKNGMLAFAQRGK